MEKIKIDINDFKEMEKQVPDFSDDGEALSVYHIPLDMLYYNDENGRIATMISSDLELNNGKSLQELTRKEYNEKLHQYVKDSNLIDRFKETYEDIKKKGQVRPAVVLSDGRVVSGNRRFTVLRELYNNTAEDKFNKLKCFVLELDIDNENERKQIKTIERKTQFAVNEKVDYNPIDRLVDIYTDLIGPKKIWDIKEYALKLTKKEKEVTNLYYKALVMVDFLEYIGKPLKFHLARTYKIDGPIQEIMDLYKKNHSNPEWNRIRAVFYEIIKGSNDRTRQVRELKKLYNTKLDGFNEVLKKCQEAIMSKENNNDNNSTPSYSINNSTISFPVNNGPESETISNIINSVSEENEKLVLDKKIKDKKDKIFNSIELFLNNIDDGYKLFNENEKQLLNEKLSDLEKIIAKFGGK